MLIKPASQQEFEIAIEWARQEGWNPGLDDQSAFFKADPQGFLLGFENEEPVAALSVVQYGDDFGFLGFYIVHPSYRGKGLGIQIWNAGMDYLADRNIGLDGVVEQQENYKKSGFSYAHKNTRYAGKTTSKPDKISAQVIAIKDVPKKQILTYDQSVFPADRTTFILDWALDLTPKRISLGYMENQKLKGFGTIRACHEGHKIGPLFADSDEVAQSLLEHLCQHAQADLVYIDVPEPNASAVKMVENLGFEPTFETARMYTKFEPNIELNKVFGITTFELG